MSAPVGMHVAAAAAVSVGPSTRAVTSVFCVVTRDRGIFFLSWCGLGWVAELETLRHVGGSVGASDSIGVEVLAE